MNLLKLKPCIKLNDNKESTTFAEKLEKSIFSFKSKSFLLVCELENLALGNPWAL